MVGWSLRAAVAAAAVAAPLLAAGPAAAEPPPPDPLIVATETSAAPPPPPPPPDPFAEASALSKADPAAALGGVLAAEPGGNPADLLNQSIGLSAPSAVNPLAGLELLTPNSYRMPSEEEPSPYALQSGVPPGPFARVDAFRGARAVAHGALGRMPGADLGQALPGTAPPPGTRLPPGLEQFYLDPNLVPAPPPAPAG